MERGTAEYLVNDEHVILSAGDALIIPPDTFHKCFSASDDVQHSAFQLIIPAPEIQKQPLPPGIVSLLHHEIALCTEQGDCGRLSACLAVICTQLFSFGYLQLMPICDPAYVIHEYMSKKLSKQSDPRRSGRRAQSFGKTNGASGTKIYRPHLPKRIGPAPYGGGPASIGNGVDLHGRSGGTGRVPLLQRLLESLSFIPALGLHCVCIKIEDLSDSISTISSRGQPWPPACRLRRRCRESEQARGGRAWRWRQIFLILYSFVFILGCYFSGNPLEEFRLLS